MKLTLAALSAFLLLNVWVYEINSDVNLRRGPDNKKKVLRTVPGGETIAVLEKTNEWWWKVQYEGTEGYIASSFISVSYPKTTWKLVQAYPWVSGLLVAVLLLMIVVRRKPKKAGKATKKKKAAPKKRK